MSELNFQEPAQDTPARLRSFKGKIIDKMPLLLSGKDAAGETVDIPRTPMTPKELLYERIHGRKKHDRTLLQDHYFHTACAVIGDPGETGEVLIATYDGALVRTLIESLNPKTTLASGTLPITNDQYSIIRQSTFVIPPDISHNLHENPYSEVPTREAFWEYVAEGDQNLVQNTLSLVKDRTKGGDWNDRMGLWLPNTPGLRLLGVNSVGISNSDAIGSSDLNNDSGRLAGVASRVKIARATLEDVLQFGQHLDGSARETFEQNARAFYERT